MNLEAIDVLSQTVLLPIYNLPIIYSLRNYAVNRRTVSLDISILLADLTSVEDLFQRESFKDRVFYDETTLWSLKRDEAALREKQEVVTRSPSEC